MGRFVAILVVFFGSFLICLFVGEVFFRFHDIGWSALSYEKTRGVVRLGHAGVIRAGSHPGVRFELKPNLDQDFKLARLQTNSEGLHDREYALEKAPGTFRVVVLGDSQSMASGVNRDENYHAVIESRIDPRALGYDRIEFINFAVGASTPGDYRDVLEHRALAYSPDLVLVGFTPGNDEIFNFSTEKKRYREKPVRDGFFQSFLLRRIQDLWSHYVGGESHDERGPFLEHHRERLRLLLGDIQRRSARAGAPVVLVYLARVERENRPEIQRLAETLGIDFVDTTPAFRDIPLDETRIYRTDRHPNPAAHRVIADTLQPHLEAWIARSASGNTGKAGGPSPPAPIRP